MQLVAIPTASIGLMWDRISPGIERMVKKGIGLHTTKQIEQLALSGAWMVFIVEDQAKIKATIIAGITDGEKRVFEIGMCWGTGMRDWSGEVYESLTTIARQLNCDSIAVTGRRGWIRYLKPRGFSEQMVTVVKEL